MPISGSSPNQLFSRTDGTRSGTDTWQQSAAASRGIQPVDQDFHDDDMATAINTCLFKNGGNAATGNIPMGGNKLTGLEAGSTTGDSVEYAQAVAAFQPIDATLTALAGVSTAADKVAYFTGVDAAAVASFTSTGRSIVGVANAPAAKGVIELAQSVTASTSTLAIDMSLGWNVALTLSATVSTFTVSNWPSGQLGRLVLDISSTGAFNITTWPTTTIWAAGSAPTITSGNGKKDTVVLTSADGSNFRGFVVAQNMS
jgi:hypothetical protein